MALLRCVPVALLALAAGCGSDGALVRVPEVRGMRAADAQHLLAAHGLRWRDGDGPPESRPGGRAHSETVIAQRPAPGREIPDDGVVALVEEPRIRLRRREVPYPPRLFAAVRRTRYPRVVTVDLGRRASCTRPRVARTALAGDVLIARVLLELPPPNLRCALASRDPSVRLRFRAPVGARAVLPGPIVRPRPTDDAYPTSWERAEAVSPDGRTLAVRWTGAVAPCEAFAGLDAEEDDDSVRLTLRTGRPAGSDPEQACIALGVPYVALVHLREPLGSRRIVDAAD